MNKMVRQYFEALHGKRVAVLGIGVSNRPLIRMLLSYGIETIACDRTEPEDLEPEVLELESLGVTLRVGASYLDDLEADVVFRTPGMHPYIPALQKLKAEGAVITSEMEAFFCVCPCTIIAVTGSDGKTTTTSLIAQMLKTAGKTVWVGGNIGQPLLPLADQMSPDDFAVVELSSFQLMNMTRSAHVAVVTNLAPNHLDVHKDMQEYVDAKKNVYRHQTTADTLVLNHDNDITRSFACDSAAHISFFSAKNSSTHDAYLAEGKLYYHNEFVLDTRDILLPGMHNVENYMAAICAASRYVSFDDIRHVAKTFTGVEHRIEFVRKLNGVRYYNDSIASSPTRTIAGLHSFAQKVILIAGGYDKQIPFDQLGSEIAAHVKRLILCGDTAEKIKKAVIGSPEFKQDCLEIVTVQNLHDAVADAYSHAVSGDIVTLSPACAAFDQFKNFMARGDCYKKLVQEL